MTTLTTIPLVNDTDLVQVRQSVRVICERLGIDGNERTRFATAISEIARNALVHGGGGSVAIELASAPHPALRVVVLDHGPGVPEDVSIGRRGGGFAAARKLVEAIEVAYDNGARVSLSLFLASEPKLDAAMLAGLRNGVQPNDERAARDELTRQNRELADALSALRGREEELSRLNRELAETNSGVLALYAELEEQTEAVRRASESKERFYSEMNHELRTPLNAIISLSEILTNGTMTDPVAMQKPLGFVRKSAQQMSELVDDLLDLARVEAGKMRLRIADFSVDDVVGALRGVFRPLHTNESVDLVFVGGGRAGRMHSDEGKLAQILRNLVSNALKFTDTGEVRVNITSDVDMVTFSVRDTGIGIAPGDQARLFEAFSRLESAHDRPVKGTGLGLTVSRRLATLLGGRIELSSEVGRGSVFELVVPRQLVAEQNKTVVVIDDDEVARYLLRDLLRKKGLAIREATNGVEGLAMIRALRPAVVLLDLNMPGMTGQEVLDVIRADRALEDVPVIINTSQVLSGGDREALSRRTLAILSKDGGTRATTQATLERALAALGL